MSWMLDSIGRVIVRYLDRPVLGYEPFTPSDPDALRQSLEPADMLLVEGKNHLRRHQISDPIDLVAFGTQSDRSAVTSRPTANRMC